MVKIGCDGSAQASPLGFQRGGQKKIENLRKNQTFFCFLLDKQVIIQSFQLLANHSLFFYFRFYFRLLFLVCFASSL
jgi:hypothetical protein